MVKEVVEALIGTFRYKGFLTKEDDNTYFIYDERDQQIIRLPKDKTVLKYEKSVSND